MHTDHVIILSEQKKLLTVSVQVYTVDCILLEWKCIFYSITNDTAVTGTMYACFNACKTIFLLQHSSSLGLIRLAQTHAVDDPFTLSHTGVTVGQRKKEHKEGPK